MKSPFSLKVTFSLHFHVLMCFSSPKLLSKLLCLKSFFSSLGLPGEPTEEGGFGFRVQMPCKHDCRLLVLLRQSAKGCVECVSVRVYVGVLVHVCVCAAEPVPWQERLWINKWQAERNTNVKVTLTPNYSWQLTNCFCILHSIMELQTMSIQDYADGE